MRLMLNYMPEIFRAFGFLFFFWSREHEPIHVHVEGNGGYAKYVLVNDSFQLVLSQNIKARDIKKITEIINLNSDIIISRWNKYFNQN